MAKRKITKITDTTGEGQQDGSGVFQETENKKEHIKETLQEKDIAKTVEFILGDNPYEAVGAIEEIHKKLYLAINKSKNEELSGTVVIKADYFDKNNHSDVIDYDGIKKAFDLMLQYPEKKIILVDIIANNLDDYKNYELLSMMYEGNKDKIALMKQAKNLRFLHFSSCDFENAIRLNKFFNEDNRENILYRSNFKESLQGCKDEEVEKGMEKFIKTWGFDPKTTTEQFNFEKERSYKNKVVLEYKAPIEAKKEIKETNETILKTIHFQEGGFPYLKEFFSTLDLAKLHLKNSIVVDLMADNKKFVNNLNHARSDMSGLKISYETLKKNPNAKIILCSLIPIDVFKQVITGTKSEEYLTTLLQGKNVRIIQSAGGNSMTKEEVRKQFDGMYEDTETSENNEGGEIFKKLSIIESESAFQKVLEGEISRFLHDAGHWIGDKKEIDTMSNVKRLAYFFSQPQENKSDIWIAFENKLIGLLQFQHPSYQHVSRERNLGGILATYTFIMQKELPEGTRFEGVFVDFDDCLYDNKKKQFNQKVLDIIKGYEKEGKTIVIWTLGNEEIKQKILDDAGLPYIIKNKTEYKGGTVEISIDNESEELLLANARIKTEQHIRV